MNSLYKLLITLIIIIVALPSCSIEKRNYRSGYHVSWHKKKKDAEKQSEDIKVDLALKRLSNIDSAEVSDGFTHTDAPLLSTIDKSSPEIVSGYKSIQIDKKNQECDNIILRSGEEISAQVLEVTIDVIKYKKCENPEGPIYSILKSDVFMIKYANGTKDIFSQEISSKSTKVSINERPKNEALGIVGMIIGIVAWFVPVLPLAIVMLIMAAFFGLASINKIQKHPDKYKGKGFGITALILGIAGIILAMIIGGEL